MIEASIEADKGNAKPLATIIHENLADRDIVLFIKQTKSYNGGNVKLFSAEEGKKYEGTVIGVTERHVMQAFLDFPNHIVIHSRNSLARLPDMDKIVEISYPRGSIGIVREPEIFKEADYPKPHSLERSSKQHEWER